MRHGLQSAAVLCLLAVAPHAVDPTLAPSVRVGGCGGTNVRQTDGHLWGISAGHCATVGVPVTVTFSDGSTATGKWLHIDRESDLAAFAVAFSTSKRVNVAQIAAQGVTGAHTANGSRGPIKLLRHGHREMKSTAGGTYDRTLYAVDELVGFIVAVALVRPSKSVIDLPIKSILKKFKDKAFCRAIDRDHLRTAAEDLGVDMRDHVQTVIASLATIAGDLELN